LAIDWLKWQMAILFEGSAANSRNLTTAASGPLTTFS